MEMSDIELDEFDSLTENLLDKTYGTLESSALLKFPAGTSQESNTQAFVPVYASCKAYIVTLQKLPDTITNEARIHCLKNRLYALYRGSKFLVISINHKITNEEINQISCNHHNVTFIKGQIVHNKLYDKSHELYTTGIKYYLTKEVAFHKHLTKYVPDYSGTCYMWQDCGASWVKYYYDPVWHTHYKWEYF